MLHEINATAGQPGTSYTFTVDARDPHFRVNAGPNRVAHVTNIDGSALRHAPVDNDGKLGVFGLLGSGATRDVVADGGDRVFMLADPAVSSSVIVKIAAA